MCLAMSRQLRCVCLGPAWGGAGEACLAPTGEGFQAAARGQSLP